LLPGERHCIGIQYALMEGCLALVTMLQRYRLTLPFGAQVIPKKISSFLEPETVMMQVERVEQ
jgi:cytochrome P450